jgi:hypothetical protein
MLAIRSKILIATNFFNTFIICGRCERTPHVVIDLLKRNTYVKPVVPTFTFARIRCFFHPSMNTVIAHTYLLESNIINCLCHGGHLLQSSSTHFLRTSTGRTLCEKCKKRRITCKSSTTATHLLAISFLYVSVVHHMNQWQLRHHPVCYFSLGCSGNWNT